MFSRPVSRPFPRAFFRPLLPLVAVLLWPALAHASGLDAVAMDATGATQAPVPLPPTPDADKTALDIYEEESSYIFGTTYREKQFRGPAERSYGSFDESQFSFDYAHRFQVYGKVYLKVGADYERFDFGATHAPLPTSLQSLTSTIALEYIVKGEVGAFIESTPGLYYSDLNSIGLGNVDAPTSIGGIVPLGKKFYMLIGARYSALAHYPIYPVVGVILVFNDHLRIEARPPTPRMIYSYSKKLDLYVGAELLGSAYKRDANPDARPEDQRYNNAVIDYSETRLGSGLVYSPTDQIDIELDGGWCLSRDLEYYRGGDASKSFRAHGAPYARIAVSANF